MSVKAHEAQKDLTLAEDSEGKKHVFISVCICISSGS